MVFSGLRVTMSQSHRRSRLARFIPIRSLRNSYYPGHLLADAPALRCGDSPVALIEGRSCVSVRELVGRRLG